jgi:hypothetical protein
MWVTLLSAGFYKHFLCFITSVVGRDVYRDIFLPRPATSNTVLLFHLFCYWQNQTTTYFTNLSQTPEVLFPLFFFCAQHQKGFEYSHI